MPIYGKNQPCDGHFYCPITLAYGGHFMQYQLISADNVVTADGAAYAVIVVDVNVEQPTDEHLDEIRDEFEGVAEGYGGELFACGPEPDGNYSVTIHFPNVAVIL
jgi:hypothetical protein